MADEKRVRVLIVDDSAPERALVRQALAGEGYAIDEASTGSRALELARLHDYDAVVLDFVLPDADGVTVLESLRGSRQRSPVVALSSSESPEVVERLIGAGAVDFLSKDHLTPLRILHSVRQALALHRADVRLAAPLSQQRRARREARPPSAPAEDVVVPALGAPLREGGTVLIVDDSDDMRFLLKRKLEIVGWSVVEAPTGRAALDAIAARRFDLVILDYLLPDTDGVKLLGDLRAAGLAAPVIALTAHGDERVAEALLLGGAADFLAKDGALWARLTLAVENVERVFGESAPTL